MRFVLTIRIPDNYEGKDYDACDSWLGAIDRPHPLPRIGEYLDVSKLLVDSFVPVLEIYWHANGAPDLVVCGQPWPGKLKQAGFVQESDTAAWQAFFAAWDTSAVPAPSQASRIYKDIP